MPAQPARIDDLELYDAERPARPVRGKLRPAPDWGSDDLFEDRVPRRRFAPVEADSGASTTTRSVTVERPTERPTLVVADSDLHAPSDARMEARLAHVEPGQRRTITITGRPGDHPAVLRERATPARRSGSGLHSLAARPDRIMGWACALGVLLIAIALLT